MNPKCVLYIIFLFLFGVEGQGQILRSGNDSIEILDNRNIFRDVRTIIQREKYQMETSEDEIMRKVDSLPAFGIYKVNYIITGVPLNASINGETADAKFQISVRHRLTTSKLPFNTFLYFTYTQKSFWDIYQHSAPFKDNNYNPGIGIGRYAIDDNKLVGGMFAILEHESNGRSEEDSRSINYLSLIGKYFFSESISFRIKMSIPFLFGKENKDILDYKGTDSFSIDYKARNSKWWLSATVSPIKSQTRINSTLSAAYRISTKFNQYIYGEFYNGTGDSLLDYKRHYSQIRVGIGIKPDFYSIF